MSETPANESLDLTKPRGAPAPQTAPTPRLRRLTHALGVNRTPCSTGRWPLSNPNDRGAYTGGKADFITETLRLVTVPPDA